MSQTPPPESFHYDQAFWKERFPSEDYVKDGDSFDDYEPAYRYGASLRGEIDDFDNNEAALRERWEQQRGQSRLDWERARDPVKIAWFQNPEFVTTTRGEVL